MTVELSFQKISSRRLTISKQRHCENYNGKVAVQKHQNWVYRTHYLKQINTTQEDDQDYSTCNALDLIQSADMSPTELYLKY